MIPRIEMHRFSVFPSTYASVLIPLSGDYCYRCYQTFSSAVEHYHGCLNTSSTLGIYHCCSEPEEEDSGEANSVFAVFQGLEDGVLRPGMDIGDG